MDEAKIRLSVKEMELVTNADWILTKNGVLEKVKSMFAALQQQMIEPLKKIEPLLPTDVSGISPKISKGENYNGLPYLVLDYPRLFNRPNILAVRTLFWWGNFFSITLHLSGNYKKQFEKNCIEAFDFFLVQGYYACINKDEWEHHFDSSNYTPVKKFSPIEWAAFIKEKSFIKIARKYPLHQWDDVANKLKADFTNITEVLCS